MSEESSYVPPTPSDPRADPSTVLAKAGTRNYHPLVAIRIPDAKYAQATPADDVAKARTDEAPLGNCVLALDWSRSDAGRPKWML